MQHDEDARWQDLLSFVHGKEATARCALFRGEIAGNPIRSSADGRVLNSSITSPSNATAVSEKGPVENPARSAADGSVSNSSTASPFIATAVSNSEIVAMMRRNRSRSKNDGASYLAHAEGMRSAVGTEVQVRCFLFCVSVCLCHSFCCTYRGCRRCSRDRASYAIFGILVFFK